MLPFRAMRILPFEESERVNLDVPSGNRILRISLSNGSLPQLSLYWNRCDVRIAYSPSEFRDWPLEGRTPTLFPPEFYLSVAHQEGAGEKQRLRDIRAEEAKFLALLHPDSRVYATYRYGWEIEDHHSWILLSVVETGKWKDDWKIGAPVATATTEKRKHK